jgi:site-specific DNA recombinase
MTEHPVRRRHGSPRVRCAIYTRKSSEEGLEQDFNSLHAQREACEAFIRSQKPEGWVLIHTPYDDGGISGATLERPGLQQLLADIHAGRIDIVVVYKVDRLSRSLIDFAKLVETFDAHQVSFVSVTQQFNTSTSMGRLTLNVLLSFAQFEREVTGERIRDKIAASKQKGLWMGGHPPLGYDVKDRQLVVNEKEAERVRYIYQRYLELGSVRSLKARLDAEGITSKVRFNTSGHRFGGQLLARGALYRLLSNRLYRGEIAHKDNSYPGQHKAIVDPDLWDQVQALLATHRIECKSGATARHPSLLAGLLFDDDGQRMTPSHTIKHGKRYRYYISQPLTTGTRNTVHAGRRIPAGDIEQLVVDRVRFALGDDATVHAAIESITLEATEQKRLLDQAGTLSREWEALTTLQVRAILCALIARIDILPKRVDMHLVSTRVAEVLRQNPTVLPPAAVYPETEPRLTLTVAAELKRAGMGMKLIIEPSDVSGRKARPDISLVKLILKAHAFNNQLVNGAETSLSAIARHEGLTGSYVTRLLRLSYLSPDITRAILDGRHPPDLTAAKLIRLSRLPLSWEEQKRILGFA